jgi:molybdopterin-containing oxidoreductase family iron-sulfur binding subunit
MSNDLYPRDAYLDPSFSISDLRIRIDEKQGKAYWRGLDELAETPEFQQELEREFPQGATEWNDPVGRRHFMKLMGASVMLAGLGACTRQPDEKILPYVKAPEQFIPGKPLYFATAMTMGGYGTGLLVESHMGRPTKVEGNPDHPASLGATDSFAQASVLSLYDPDRSSAVKNRSRISSWEAFVAAVKESEGELKSNGGAGLRLLTETVTSPTLADQIKTLLAKYPNAKWYQYEPATRDNVREGSRMAFGSYVDAIYHFDKAEVILSIDADFLLKMPGSVRYAREFSRKRRVTDGGTTMNRLYAVESTPTITGAMADHRRALAPSEVEALAWKIAGELGVGTAASASGSDKWIAAVARDLKEKSGRSLVIAGDECSPAIHALVHAMNAALSNVGRSVVYINSVEANPANQLAGLGELLAEMEGGRVTTLVMLGGNPAYNTPGELKFAEKMAKVKNKVHLSLYDDETSYRSEWHIPETHFLEQWSDVRSFEGTVSIVQPLIAPMYGGRSSHEVLTVLIGDPAAPQSPYDTVRAYWQKGGGLLGEGNNFDEFWKRALHDGLVRNTASTEQPTVLRADWNNGAAPAAAVAGAIELVLRADPTVWDGRFANIGWLQELPKPMTLLTWDNALLVSPKFAEKEGELQNGDMVELTSGKAKLEVPIWITPGQPDNTVALYLGYGRERAGRVGDKLGFNAYTIRSVGTPWHVQGVTVRRTSGNYDLATTQTHHSMEGRDIVRAGTLKEYLSDPVTVNHSQGTGPDARRIAQQQLTAGRIAAGKEAKGEHEAKSGHEEHPSFYPEHPYDGYGWGMTIDLNSCIGCNACIIACQSENNIPVVGKEQVLFHREMHWIRVDRYYSGNLDQPVTDFQPIPCMQCENAPCEPVCPVGATVHSAEGLNDMVYNRCVGTRYCSNNCPYKVRRFNFLRYNDVDSQSLTLMRNPDVTVRSRGVMEKCTYCVQRINHARIDAKKEDRMINDGEIVTACQQVCPTESIVFGDIHNTKSRVTKLKKHPLNYSLLEDLGTRPRTTYLAKLRNPNPELSEGAA